MEKGRAQQAVGDDGAVATLQSLLDLSPLPPLLDEARFRLAESLIDAHREAEALTILLGLGAEPKGPFASQALFLAARVQRHAGNLTQAIDLYTRYVQVDASLAGYAQREIAALQEALGQREAASASYRAVLAAGLPDDSVQGARRHLAQLATQLKNDDEALSWWSQYQENASAAWERTLAIYSTALIQQQSGAVDAAAASFMRLVQTYPDSNYSVAALTAVLAYGKDVPLLQQGQVYFSNRQNDKAIAVYQRYLAQFPDGDNVGRVRYNMAVLQQRLGNLEKAMTEFDAVHSQFPNETFARAAWLEVARTLLRLDRNLDAAMFFEKIAAWYPQAPETEQALWEGGMIYHRLSRPRDAARLFGRLRQGFPKSAGFSRAALWEAKSLLAGGDAVGASAALATINGDTRPDYYTLRAGELLAGSGRAAPTPPPVAPAGSERAEFVRWLEGWAGSATTPDVQSDAHVQRGLLLWRLRSPDDAATELALARGARRDDAWALLAYSEYMSGLGLPYQSVAAANRILALSGRGVTETPLYLQRLLYPTPYRDLVQAMAKQYGVDASWLFALIRQESLFDRYGFSSAEARGLTQVIPATGNEIAGRLGVTDFRQDDLFKPALSIRFGAWYLAQQSKLGSGNMVVALAAYNGGPGNALKWAKAQPAFDQDLFVEDVAFSETRAYVKLVFQFHSMYASLWATP